MTLSPESTTGARIRALRTAAGMSLTQLAETAEISKSYLSNLESREQDKRPSAHVLLKIAKALGVTMAELMGHATSETTPTQLEPSLKAYAEDHHLTAAELDMLASIKFRGDAPRTAARWQFIHHALRASRDLDT